MSKKNETTTVQMRELRERLTAILDVVKAGQVHHITRHGTSQAVLLAPDRYSELLTAEAEARFLGRFSGGEE